MIMLMGTIQRQTLALVNENQKKSGAVEQRGNELIDQLFSLRSSLITLFPPSLYTQHCLWSWKHTSLFLLIITIIGE
ncbi:hypothetical protein PGT21_031521 [Puccinia graminis f. sp. tritici]|uniref:Uncharacterized protein n=1 Tax=Puccinia graminis f. sp. tritici TaxID=56615 RepID=A0A5B0P1L1_PUCGR|nr:hypothetical protein PGT21_031521 [Puccinia graminis f. sp. tritici]